LRFELVANRQIFVITMMVYGNTNIDKATMIIAGFATSLKVILLQIFICHAAFFCLRFFELSRRALVTAIHQVNLF
jgi:hypothetical protein